jgi:GNAT superfamily N-acetyltransferase
MARPSGRIEGLVAPVPDLVIERVTDDARLLRFEATASEGFGSGPVAARTWHGPDVLADPRLEMWLGLVGGRPAAVSMGFADAGVLGIYGVATMPGMRRRGLATALTAHTLTQAPGLPAVLQPSRVAESLYRRLGFTRFGSFRSWARDR